MGCIFLPLFSGQAENEAEQNDSRAGKRRSQARLEIGMLCWSRTKKNGTRRDKGTCTKRRKVILR